MRKKLLKAVEREFLERVQEALPGFEPCGEMAMWEPAVRLSIRDDLHFFLALDPLDDRDCFDVTCGLSKSSKFPMYVGTLSPSDPLENDALAFPVGSLWQKDGMPTRWCLSEQREWDDPTEYWLKPSLAQEELLPKVPEVVERCIRDLREPVLQFIAEWSMDVTGDSSTKK